MNSRRITVLIADDQDLIRDALRALLDREPGIEIVGQARNGFEAVDEARRLKPDIVLMDVRMPALSGPEATARIRSAQGLKGTRVVILTTFEEDDVVRACVRAGADGVIGKGAPSAALIDAIRAVASGRSFLSPRAARALAVGPGTTDRAGAPTPFSGLTSRELDIVKLVGLGMSNEDIGRRLSISTATAKTHVRNAMKKLDVHDRAQLVVLIHRSGI